MKPFLKFKTNKTGNRGDWYKKTTVFTVTTTNYTVTNTKWRSERSKRIRTPFNSNADIVTFQYAIDSAVFNVVTDSIATMGTSTISCRSLSSRTTFITWVRIYLVFDMHGIVLFLLKLFSSHKLCSSWVLSNWNF